jgi:hypothetical protein
MVGSLLVNIHLDDQEGGDNIDGTEGEVVRIGSGWNWLRIISSGWIWY